MANSSVDPLAPAVIDLAGAIARAGCNLPGAAIVRCHSAVCRLYVAQAQDVLRDLHVPAMKVLRAARMAVHDHVLFDGPHDRPTALLDHGPTQNLLAAVLSSTEALFTSHVEELQRGSGVVTGR